MNPILFWVLTLLGVVLLLLAIAGVRPRPADGSWLPLTTTGRAGLTVIAAVLILVGWLFRIDAFGHPDQESRQAFTETGSSRPPDPAWDEVAAELQRRRAEQPLLSTSPPPSTPAATPAPAPVASGPDPTPPGPASVSAPTTVAATPTAIAAAPLPAPPAGAPAAGRPARPAAPRKPAPRRATTRADGSVSVCELQGLCGIDARSYGLPPRSRGHAAPATSRPTAARKPAALPLRLHDRLGPDQLREVLRVEVGGVARGSLDLGSARGSGTLAITLPPGAAEYRLSGYTEYADGRRVPLHGIGWLDPGLHDYELRVVDAATGAAMLEPSRR